MKLRRFFLSLLLSASTLPLLALSGMNNGGVNYDLGVNQLKEMTYFVVMVLIYSTDILYAIAGILVVYNSTVIYIKMQTGEQGVVKNIMMLIGACLFITTMIIVLPSFFGFTYRGGADGGWSY
jgi:hypothetical protein